MVVAVSYVRRGLEVGAEIGEAICKGEKVPSAASVCWAGRGVPRGVISHYCEGLFYRLRDFAFFFF